MRQPSLSYSHFAAVLPQFTAAQKNIVDLSLSLTTKLLISVQSHCGDIITFLNDVIEPTGLPCAVLTLTLKHTRNIRCISDSDNSSHTLITNPSSPCLN